MIFAEYSFLSIVDIPHISTIFYVDASQWKIRNIQLTDDKIILKVNNESDSKTIMLKDIESVNRPLSPALSNKIKNSSRHGSFLLIDYKREAKIGNGEILSTLILAGKKTEISSFRYFFQSILGEKIDPLLASVRPEDIRLLVLLDININKVDVLIPIFNGDKELLQKSFSALKSKNMVDDYAQITQKGRELLEKVKGIERKKMGMKVNDKFREISSYWQRLDQFPDVPGTSKIVWKLDESSLSGNVLTKHISKYIPLNQINEANIGLCNESMLGLLMEDSNKANIFFRSSDFSVVLTVHEIIEINSKDNKSCDVNLSKKSKRPFSVLLCHFLGIKDKKEILNCLTINESELSYYHQWFFDKNLIDPIDMELTDEGLNHVFHRLAEKCPVLLDMEVADVKTKNFNRYEQVKMINSKKRVMTMLKKKHTS